MPLDFSGAGGRTSGLGLRGAHRRCGGGSIGPSRSGGSGGRGGRAIEVRADGCSKLLLVVGVVGGFKMWLEASLDLLMLTYVD